MNDPLVGPLLKRGSLKTKLMIGLTLRIFNTQAYLNLQKCVSH